MIQLTIADQLHTLTPLAEFTAEYHLPPTFGTPLLAIEAPTNHSRIWHTRTAELSHIQHRLPQLVPSPIHLGNATTIPQTMAVLLHGELLALAVDTDLTVDEIDFVVDECRNVWEAVAYKLVQLSYLLQHDGAAVRQQFALAPIYQETLDSTVLLNEQTAEYTHEGQVWAVQLIQSVYGPLGLAITLPNGQTRYVADAQLTFPGLPFMAHVGQAVGQKMADMFVGK